MKILLIHKLLGFNLHRKLNKAQLSLWLSKVTAVVIEIPSDKSAVLYIDNKFRAVILYLWESKFLVLRVCVCVRARKCEWKPEVSLGHQSSGTIHFVFWDRICRWTLGSLIGIGWDFQRMPSCPAVGMHGCWDWTEVLRLYQLSCLATPPSDFTCWHALLSQQKLYEQHKLSWMVKNSNRTQSWIGGVALGGSEEEVNIVIYSSRIYPVLSSPKNNTNISLQQIDQAK